MAMGYHKLLIFFVEMFLGRPSIGFLQAKMIGRKIWPHGGGAILPFIYFRRTFFKWKLKKCSPEINNFVEMSLGDPLSDSFKPCWLVEKTWLPKGWAILLYMAVWRYNFCLLAVERPSWASCLFTNEIIATVNNQYTLSNTIYCIIY